MQSYSTFKQYMLPRKLHLRVTSNCNMKCVYCFGPSGALGNFIFENFIELFNLFWNNGVHEIVITGGEPLLHLSIEKMIIKLKEIGFIISLSTNGLLLKNILAKILPFTDNFYLPLDGDNTYTHSALRRTSTNHFYLILDLIRLIKSNKPNAKIKICTVVSDVNKDNILGIINVINTPYKPDMWKLFQVVYSNDDMLHNACKLNDEEYLQIVNYVKCKAQSKGLNTSSLSRKDRNGRYLLIKRNSIYN